MLLLSVELLRLICSFHIQCPPLSNCYTRAVKTALTNVNCVQRHFALHYTKSLYIKKAFVSSNSGNFFTSVIIFSFFTNISWILNLEISTHCLIFIFSPKNHKNCQKKLFTSVIQQFHRRRTGISEAFFLSFNTVFNNMSIYVLKNHSFFKYLTVKFACISMPFMV